MKVYLFVLENLGNCRRGVFLLINLFVILLFVILLVICVKVRNFMVVGVFV